MKVRILIFLSLACLTATTMCASLYLYARVRISALGLDAGREPLEGTLPVRGIHTISAGALVSRAEIIQDLKDSGFSSTTAKLASGAGTYTLSGENGLVVSRGSESGPIRISWFGPRIHAIQIDGKQVEAIEIPSAVLFRLHRKDEDLAEYFSQRQDFADDAEIKASVLPSILIAVEDRDFEEHGGVAPRSLLGAALDALRGRRMRGAGTLTMQLARTLIWPGEDPAKQGLMQKNWRKINEWFLASAIEQKLTKKQIERAYINSVDCGSIPTASGRRHALKGFKALARYLFGVNDLRNVTLAQAAAMVAILPSPNHYLNDLMAMRTRRDTVVLKTFASQDPEQAAAAQAAMQEPLSPALAKDDRSEISSYGFVLDSWRSSPAWQGDAHTDDLDLSVDPDLQRAADSALGEELYTLRQLLHSPVDGALVALDPETGKVHALVGGDQFPELDSARMAFRTGSTVKPVYGALALDIGSVNGEPLTAASILDTSDCEVAGWSPNDAERERYLDTREALARSSDCGAIVVAKSIGLESACHAIGLALENRPICSGPAFIGGAAGSEATPLHMAEAYAAFVNGGRRIDAQFSSKLANGPKTMQLFSPSAAFVEVQMMRSVMGNSIAGRPTAASARVWSGLPANAQLAGKTGTDGANRFWIGVVQPHLVVVVVISASSKIVLSERDGFTGGIIAGRVWANFVRRSVEREPYYFSGSFSQPDGVEWLEINRARGCLQTGAKDYEVFLAGRVPRFCY
jgi:membrane peptidoglycan carboxypeptidase